jgi:hypothetical protein
MLLLCMIALLSGCGVFSGYVIPRDPANIKQAEAEQLLNLAVQYAQARDLDKLCGLSGSELGIGFCKMQFSAEGGWDAVPKNPPQIVDSYVAQGNGNYGTEGFVLVLEGVDGLGNSYRTDFIVQPIPEAGPINAWVGVFMPYYWSNLKNTPAAPGTTSSAPASATPAP